MDIAENNPCEQVDPCEWRYQLLGDPQPDRLLVEKIVMMKLEVSG
jgi:hypothetical protein